MFFVFTLIYYVFIFAVAGSFLREGWHLSEESQSLVFASLRILGLFLVKYRFERLREQNSS